MMRHSLFLSLLFLSILTATARPLGAQKSDDPEHWAAEVGFSLNTSGGNEQLTVLTSQVGLSHLETSSYEASIGGRLRYGRSEGEKVAQNLRGNTTLDLWPESRFTPFLFATAENDPFKKLRARLNSGSGVKQTYWRDGWSEVSASGALLYSYENIRVDEPLGARVKHNARWSWRSRARKQIGDGRRVEHVIFFQPVWDQLGDYLLESETSARWSLTRTLAFTTTLLYERDSTPAEGVGANDWSLAVGLTAATRW